MSDRAKYCKPGDFAYGLGLNRIESIIVPKTTKIDVNDAIEFHEIKQYFDDGTRLRSWSEEQYIDYKNKSNDLYKLAMRHFNTLSGERLIEEYTMVEPMYQHSFWALFDKCHLYERITGEAFKDLISMSVTSPSAPFEFEGIVNHYDAILREFILNKPGMDEMLFLSYESIQSRKKITPYYLPKSITTQDICECIDRYIESESPNANRLMSIVQMKNTGVFQISDDTRLRAKKRYNKEIERLSQNGISVWHGIEVTLSPDISGEREICCSDNCCTYRYSEAWLNESLDYPSILNNFIFLFEFVDSYQFRCKLVSKMSECEILEKVLLSKQRHIYPANSQFRDRNAAAIMQMSMYYEYLKAKGISLEKVYEWFFTQYIQEEFNCSEMRGRFPGENTSYAEKCACICNVIEAVIKQYTLFVRHGEIDFELLQISSGSEGFASVPSLVKNKYLHGKGSVFESLSYMLFSNQCMLAYVKRDEKEQKWHESFCDLLLKEPLHFEELKTYEQEQVLYLKENGVVAIDDGVVHISDYRRIAVLRDLYVNEVVSQYHYPQYMGETIQEMVERGVVSYGQGLFSSPEVDYFNFLLNNSSFTNGKQLRNKYSHGVQQSILDEDEHRNNYMVLLVIVTIMTIKINDDFLIWKKTEK